MSLSPVLLQFLLPVLSPALAENKPETPFKVTSPNTHMPQPTEFKPAEP